jgi:hypothetical protein
MSVVIISYVVILVLMLIKKTFTRLRKEKRGSALYGLQRNGDFDRLM